MVFSIVGRCRRKWKWIGRAQKLCRSRWDYVEMSLRRLVITISGFGWFLFLVCICRQGKSAISLWHIRKFLAKVACASNFRKKTCASDFRKCTMTHLKVETQKLQVKSGVSWVLLYFECRFNLTTTTTIMFFCDFQCKILLSVIMHSITTMTLQSITSRVSDWPITAHHLRKKTFRNRTRFISKSWLSQVKTCASVYATLESFLSKVAFERKLSNVSYV